MPSWPASLNFCPVNGSYQEQPVDAVLRTEMDAGPVKTRPRFTAVPTNISFTLPKMTRAEYVIFRDWFNIDLERGALSFDALHPLTRQSGNFRFRAPYSVALPGKSVVISVQLELLP